MPPSRQRSCTHDDGHPRGLIPRSHLPSPGAVRFFDVHSFDGAAPQKQCGVIHLAGFVLDCVLLSRLVQSIVRNISKLDGLAQRCEDRGRSWRRGWRRGREVFTTGWIAIRGKAGLALAHFYHVPDVPARQVAAEAGRVLEHGEYGGDTADVPAGEVAIEVGRIFEYVGHGIDVADVPAGEAAVEVGRMVENVGPPATTRILLLRPG